MIHPRHRAEAKAIGDDSWELLNFQQLRRNASVKSQVEALERDRKWQEDHQTEITHRIDRLIRDIVEGGR